METRWPSSAVSLNAPHSLFEFRFFRDPFLRVFWVYQYSYCIPHRGYLTVEVCQLLCDCLECDVCSGGVYIAGVAILSLQSGTCLSHQGWVTGQEGLNIPYTQGSTPRLVRLEADMDASANAVEVQLISGNLMYPHGALVNK